MSARRWAAGLLAGAGAILVLAPATPAGAATLPPGFQDQVVLSGLDDPTSIVFNQDGTRVFVALKGGQIEEFDGIGDPTPTEVADLRTEVYNHFDRGLLGLALDPQYTARPYLYALYSLDAPPGQSPPYWGQPGVTGDPCVDPSGGACTVTGRLARLTLNPSTGVEISKQNLVTDWCDQSSTHSIGDLAFGPDGALYASGGDGAEYSFIDWGQSGSPPNPCGDPPGGVGADLEPPTAEGGSLRSQDVETSGDPAGLDGTIIRVNPDTGAGMPGNPFVASADANKRRIVAYGLRNPFRFTVKPGTDEVWTGDVGRNDFEEINRLTDPTDSTADNFGWPCYEGNGVQAGFAAADLNICQSLYSKGNAFGPYFTYAHGDHIVSGEGCTVGSSAVSGVAFNGAGTYPSAYDGALFFADYARSCIWAMLPGTGGEPNPDDVVTLDDGATSPVKIKLGPDGDLYYVDLWDGQIHRITYTGGNQPPHAVATATPANSHSAPLTTQLDASGSSDPEGDALTYHWDLDQDGSFDDATGAVPPPKSYATTGVYHPAVQVTDSHGASDVATVEIQVGNTPPVADITTPTSGFHWATGDTVAFSGSATDAEQTLSASNYRWRVVLHHCPSNCHEHGLEQVDDATSGSFTAPDHDYPAYLTIKLTVTDDGGLSDTESVDIQPSTVQLTVQTNPTGIQIGLDGTIQPAPVAATVIENSHHTLSAPSAVNIQGNDYSFASWSDGGALTHSLTVSADRTLIATYDPLAPVPTASPPGPTKKKKAKCRKHGKKSAKPAKAKCKRKKKH